jgi:DNA-directed RNA polymerase subunit RPC12/RpoP
MGNDQIDLLCEHCGQTLSAFLHEMAEKNAKVVCPNCGGSHDHTNEKPNRLPEESRRPTSPE